MPNWVSNTIVISGEPVILGTLREQLNKPVTKHFPKTEFANGSVSYTPDTQTYSNPVFSFWNVIAPTDLDAYYDVTPSEPIPDGVNIWDTIRNDFATKNDWYNWNVRNWGTKWDIAVADSDEYADTQMEIVDGNLMYRFNTAWSPVFEIFNTLSKQYPSLVFDYDYEEEQGWGGEATWKDGEMILHSEYDEPNCHADYVERDLDCPCEFEEDPEYWFDDCPRKVEA